MKIQIIGTGSAGMHFIRAASLMGAELITISDTNAEMVKTLGARYKERYGVDCPAVYGPGDVDVTVIATPPDTHIALAVDACKRSEHVIIEKPLCAPGQFEQLRKADMDNTKVWVNYQYVIHPAIEWLKANLPLIQSPVTCQVMWQEHSDFCAKAHPWKNDDWYLFDSKRGGGAACEHSHGLALFVLCLAACGQGTLQTVGHKIIKDGHDVFSQFDGTLSDDQGNLIVAGTVVQDFLRRDPIKALHMACEEATASVDFITQQAQVNVGGREFVDGYAVSREQEFTLILKHIQDADYASSPLALHNVMLVQEILSGHFKEPTNGLVH